MWQRPVGREPAILPGGPILLSCEVGTHALPFKPKDRTMASHAKFVWDDPLQLDAQLTDDERAVRDASEDPGVHGVLVYYPVGSSEGDAWLRELVDPRKDLEGLHSFWARCLYENRRYTDAGRTKKAILPCTPLAILKLLDAAGASKPGAEKPLAGVRACVRL